MFSENSDELTLSEEQYTEEATVTTNRTNDM